MYEEEYRELFQMGVQRDEAYYKWLRHILLMATGGLALLVSLNTGVGAQGLASWMLRGTWISLGVGILCGAIDLYSEVWKHQRLLTLLGNEHARVINEREAGNHSAVAVPITTGRPPFFLRASRMTCHFSLALGVIFLVIFAVAKG